MNFDEQSYFFQCRSIARITAILWNADMKKISHNFAFSRLDYRDSLFSCLTRAAVKWRQLQLIESSQRTCFGFLALSSSFVQNSVQNVKIILVTYSSQYSLAPCYKRELLCPYTITRHPGSSSQGCLSIPWWRLEHPTSDQLTVYWLSKSALKLVCQRA